jgi:glycosyltransferase involved in cell wall biosynthesis
MRFGMVGTRFAGLDGVSLESAKIAALLRAEGHDVVWFAGERDSGFSPGVTVPSAHFRDELELARQALYFGGTRMPAHLLDDVRAAANALAEALRDFVSDFDIDALMPQNALAIPMQVPLAIAIAEVIAEGTPAIAHHHDFAWEKPRFVSTSIGHLIDAHFPPRLPGIEHWVISSIARAELARRSGVSSQVLPNVMDFAAGPPPQGDATEMRRAAGIRSASKLLLHPTRVVPRKSIETTIDLAARLGDDCTVVVTHEEGDEGLGYGDSLRKHAELARVDLVFLTSDGIGSNPRLEDAYAAADLVVYPSRSEGFGNALIEAFFYRRPVLVRRYPVYVTDIAPTGVRCIEIDDYLTDEAVHEARLWLDDPAMWDEAVESNYDIGRRRFSLEAAGEVVRRSLAVTQASLA